MGAFDAVVISSRTEGTPMVLLEGMAAGVPMIVTSVGGIPDVIGPDEGLLVPPQSPSHLANAIRIALDDPEASRRRTFAARERLRNCYGGTQWCNRYIDLYDQVISAWKKR
jgi:glycosyltransferase involved in cell wall biosynthesis